MWRNCRSCNSSTKVSIYLKGLESWINRKESFQKQNIKLQNTSPSYIILIISSKRGDLLLHHSAMVKYSEYENVGINLFRNWVLCSRKNNSDSPIFYYNCSFFFFIIIWFLQGNPRVSYARSLNFLCTHYTQNMLRIACIICKSDSIRGIPC